MKCCSTLCKYCNLSLLETTFTRSVIDTHKFGQLQAVDLQSFEPALRADTEGDNLRHDIPETFDNRGAILSAVPSYEDPYIKVPKILNKE
ncbi:hypothetical protein MKW94_004245 [Papaver nudicaule]|uniref:Glu-AdT subunit C n=1 Tax=Papaver nudicaule TaxID=74823 RepID=A0AA41V7N0_PAPNU|nr:hypothetical protein [Papaver nudicaule]